MDALKCPTQNPDHIIAAAATSPVCALLPTKIMSVYTTVETTQLEQFLTRYELGKLLDFQPIAAGITNTNYYLDTELGRFVLTLYEHHSDTELDYMLGLQQHLANQSVRCSEPVKDRCGNFYSNLNQRPAAIIHRLQGEVQPVPSSRQCALIGAELARFHLAGGDYVGLRANPRGIDWILAARDRLGPNFAATDLRDIAATLDACRRFDLSQLPRGAIHADLFHDNALFLDDELGGIFDFDYACHDSFVFDIAVLLNDWCIDSEGRLVAVRVSAVVDAYQQQRNLETIELEALPLMLRLGALRFWLSRLYDKYFPLSGELTFIKSPDEFRRIHQLRSSMETSFI
jgi:homoserine kinase type II